MSYLKAVTIKKLCGVYAIVCVFIVLFIGFSWFFVITGYMFGELALMIDE